MFSLSKYPFSIHQADGNIYPTLVKAFLLKKTLSAFDMKDGVITVEGITWTLLIEHRISDKLMKGEDVECILSFQMHKDRITGEFTYIAVAKLYKPFKKDGSLRRVDHV